MNKIPFCPKFTASSLYFVTHRLFSKILGKHWHSWIFVLFWPVLTSLQNDAHIMWEKKIAPLRGTKSNHHYFPVRGLCAALHVRLAVHNGTWVICQTSAPFWKLYFFKSLIFPWHAKNSGPNPRRKNGVRLGCQASENQKLRLWIFAPLAKLESTAPGQLPASGPQCSTFLK